MLSRTIILLSFVGVIASCGNTVDPRPNDCSMSDIAINLVASTDASGCTTNDGSLTVSGSGGEGDYQFAISGQDFQNSGEFTNLAPGVYSVLVKEGNGCEAQLSVNIGSNNGISITDISTFDSGCEEANGSILVSASGSGNLQYKIGTSSFGSSNEFTSLASGTYTVTVLDEGGCELTQEVTVNSGTEFSVVKSILSSNCVSCHPNFNVDNNIVTSANSILTRTRVGGGMPPSGPLPQEQRDAIACWVNDGANL